MDYSSWLKLDLSVDPVRCTEEAPVTEVKTEPLSCTTQLPGKLWLHDRADALTEELNRVTAENKRLTEMLTAVCENYNALKKQFIDYTGQQQSSSNDVMTAKKRKIDAVIENKNDDVLVRSSESTSGDEDSYEKPKEEALKAQITTVAVRTQTSDMIVKDGYQWRKYGQKVTRDNPCPRAYFKCSFAPTCPVKKKVQRSIEDQSVIVATYEGEHNHPPPDVVPGTAVTTATTTPRCTTVMTSSGPNTVTLDLTKPKPNITEPKTQSFSQRNVNSTEFHKLLAEQMASTLTKDANFTAALAAAISGRYL